MKRIKFLFAVLLSCAMMTIAPSCDKDNDSPQNPGNPENPGDSMSGNGDYGQLGTNMVATGGTRAVSYTQAILLGTVDFSKLGDTHTFGVVYMQGITTQEGTKPYDYNLYLVDNGAGVKNFKVNTTADGKFEKQIVDLMPGTTYYYRSYIKIGNTYNYAEVKSFSTLNPTSQINLVTGDAEEICALSSVLVGRASIGNVNNGLDQTEIKNQFYGFIYSDDSSLGTPETLTMEYWENWDNTHFDTQKKPARPVPITTKDNINSLLQQLVQNLIPGTTYYYRTVFIWNDKYFYSPEVKSFTTLGPSTFTVGTLKPEEIRNTTAILKGHVPFEKIGTKGSLPGGFMISKKYSHQSEFVMPDKINQINPWPSPSDLSYIPCQVSDVDFYREITNLEANTQYYICAYIELGKEKDTIDKYGDVVTGKKIYLYGDVISFTTTNVSGYIDIETSKINPWVETNSKWSVSIDENAFNSTAALYIQLEAEKYGTLSFDWDLDTESSKNSLKIYSVNEIVDDVYPADRYLRREYKGKGNSTYSQTFTPGEYTIVVIYERNENTPGQATISKIEYK